jgi:cytochrome oxidase Cu insertion factor (SCO1/SenC/PrrC family)
MNKLVVPVWTVMLYLAVIGCASKPEKRAESKVVVPPEINDLPAVILIEPNGKQFSTQSLSGNTILIFFGASCDHCQREATQIHNNLKSFERYTLYFISMDPFPVINQFARDYGIDKQPNIRFMRADGASVSNSLGYLQTPTILIYASNRKLIKRFDGETKVEDILKVL